MQKQLLAGGILAMALVAGGAFYGGMKYQQSKVPVFGMRGQAAFGQLRDGAGGPMARRVPGTDGLGVAGDVLLKDATGFTLKLRDGGSKNIVTTSSTRVSKMTDGSIEDVGVGTSVTILGTTNSDGSLTATQVQLRPTPSVQAPPKP